jgi:thiol-disulfide isomerase/thioredoxin
MKKLIYLIFTLSVVLMGCGSVPEHAIIRGTLSPDAKTSRLDLNKIENGLLVPVASVLPDQTGVFSFMQNVETPGLYVITLHNREGARLNSDHWLNRFWLENGEEIEIQLTDHDYTLVSASSSENIALSEWNSMIDTVFVYAYPFGSNTTFKEFFPLVPQYVEMAANFSKTVKTGNKEFDSLLRFIVDSDIAFACIYFIQTPRSAHPDLAEFPEYYTELLSRDFFSNTRLLNVPSGRRMLGLYQYMWYRMNYKGVGTGSFSEAKKLIVNLIPNDTLKGFLAIEGLRSFRTYDELFVKFVEETTPYLLTPYLKDQVAQHELSIRKFEPGAAAYDFAGTDITGKEFKLSDFTGKLVYVDVWATWCAPCKAEIPHLKTLEVDYHNKDVVFLSISVDPPTDREKWVKYVKDENLKGVQIMADKAFDSDVAKPYGITAIPRFMLFNKDGKVITIDAPRPSNKEIRTMLDKYL